MDDTRPVDGSSKMPDAHMDPIGPFEFGSALDFSAEYAAGFLMEVADESPEECFRRVESRARNTFDIGVKLSIRDEYG